MIFLKINLYQIKGGVEGRTFKSLFMHLYKIFINDLLSSWICNFKILDEKYIHPSFYWFIIIFFLTLCLKTYSYNNNLCTSTF